MHFYKNYLQFATFALCTKKLCFSSSPSSPLPSSNNTPLKLWVISCFLTVFVQTPLSLYSLNFAVISPSGAFCHLSRAFQVANSPSIKHYLPNLWMFSTDPNFRNFLTTWLMVILGMPSSVAQSDACPTGDQEVAGPIPGGSSNILPWRLNLK